VTAVNIAVVAAAVGAGAGFTCHSRGRGTEGE
jgi:hypothetical protein